MLQQGLQHLLRSGGLFGFPADQIALHLQRPAHK